MSIATDPVRPAPPPNRLPIDVEGDIEALPLAGELPPGLEGTLVRNGPNPLVPDPRAHWFGGDGMLHAFRIAGGRVDYRNRWVRTVQLDLARRTGRNPLDGMRLAKEFEGIENDGAANTHIVGHAGRLFALEEAHLPIEVALPGLDTRGPTDFGGGLRAKPFTAHPKTDPATGELLFFGYGTPERLSAGMSFGVLSPQGEVTRFETFEAPYASMVHDFAITERFAVFPVMPLTASRERAESGRPPYAWEPQHGTRVGLLPRAGGAAGIQWWGGPACYVFHVMNAWEDGERVFLDVMQYAQPPLFPLPDGRPSSPDGPAPAVLVRWELDLADPSRTLRTRRLHPVSGEFPRIDDRRTGLPYRHGWFTGNLADAQDQPLPAGALVHVDHASERIDLWALPAGDRASEPVFVPRHAGAPEGDGWVLAVLYRAASHTSDLAVFDACRLSAGPLCLASLPHRVPEGFHGNWFAAGAVAQGAA